MYGLYYMSIVKYGNISFKKQNKKLICSKNVVRDAIIYNMSFDSLKCAFF